MNAKEILIDALPMIKQFAPTLAGAIGGPIGLAASYIIPILANAFGVNVNDLKNLSSTIINHPNAQSLLTNLEQNHSDFINKLLNNLNDLQSAEVTIKLGWKVD